MCVERDGQGSVVFKACRGAIPSAGRTSQVLLSVDCPSFVAWHMHKLANLAFPQHNGRTYRGSVIIPTHILFVGSPGGPGEPPPWPVSPTSHLPTDVSARVPVTCATKHLLLTCLSPSLSRPDSFLVAMGSGLCSSPPLIGTGLRGHPFKCTLGGSSQFTHPLWRPPSLRLRFTHVWVVGGVVVLRRSPMAPTLWCSVSPCIYFSPDTPYSRTWTALDTGSTFHWGPARPDATGATIFTL